MKDKSDNMALREALRHCPRCGSGDFKNPSGNTFKCGACGFQYFLNAATAVGAIIRDDKGRVLLIKRGINPGKGLFGLPGGFVEPQETVESALRREVKEEVNLDLTALKFLCSQPNQYFFHGVVYPVLDFFFVCEAASLGEIQALDETDGFSFFAPAKIPFAKLAFPSVKKALKIYVRKINSKIA